METKEIIFYVIIGILILGLLFFTFFPGTIQAWKDSGRANSGEDICKIQPGYTEESWRDHISHHPNIYKECLG